MTPERYLDPIRRMLADKLVSSSEECFDNFSTILTFHAWIDRLLTMLIFFRLLKAHRITTETDPGRLINVIADLGFSARVDLAESLLHVGPDVASGMRQMNALRNRLAHWKVRKARVVDDISELTTDDALKAVIPNCVVAAIGLSKAIDELEESDGPTR